MRRQIDHMRRLVDDLLDVSRITRGKFEIRRDAVLMQAVVEQSVETVEPATKGRASPIDVRVCEAACGSLDEETRLVQAVSNLLTNALRYGGDGKISVRLEAAGRTARLEVADTGVGMDADTLERVFEPFFQAPQSSARQIGGLGLGLAIVRSIVTLHGGEVRAASAGPGAGKLVRDRTSRRTGRPSASPRRSGARAATDGRGVVVVDDNVDALEMVAEALRAAGHEVETISSAYEALARIPSLNPDVAILRSGHAGNGRPATRGRVAKAPNRAGTAGWWR